jgi:hypothetical protein
MDQLFGIDLGDILVLHDLEDVGIPPEKLGIPIGFGLGTASEKTADHGAGDDQGERDSEG